MSKDDDTLCEAKEAFELCSEREHENRTDAVDDIRFARLSEQWPERLRQEREKAGSVCLTINVLPTIIRQVVNDSRQNKPSIKVVPADSKADRATAEIYDGLIRHIENASRADQAYDTAVDCAVTSGFGYFRIGTRYACDDTFDLDLVIDRISNPFSVYGDPNSSCATSEDWNTAFVVDRKPKAEFEREYKDAEKVDWNGGIYGVLKGTWLDDDGVLVAEWWSREKVNKTILLLSDQQVMAEDVYAANKAMLDAIGITVIGEREVPAHKVTQRIMTGAEILKTTEWAGRFIPLVPVYGDEVNLEGRRYFRSLIRDAKDPCRMMNYWRSQSTQLVALAPKAPFVGPKGAFETDRAKWETANTEMHAYIEYDGQVPPQRQGMPQIPAGAIQEALNASDDIKRVTGIHDASLGARSNETSGRAIIARQREGDVSTFHFIDNLSRAIGHAGYILIDLIPKVYSGERIVRVLGQDGAATTVQLGKPVPQVGQDGQPMTDPATGQPLSRIFDLGVGKYDLTVKTGPGFTTRREEAATQMMELVRAFPAAAPIMGDLIAKNLDWPGADEIEKRIRQVQEQMLQAQQGGGQEQQADPAAVAQAQADAQKAQSDTALKGEELKIKAYEAETARMEAVWKMNEQRIRAASGGIAMPQGSA